MSFFKKLFGGTFEDHFAEGSKLFDAGSFGPAKLALERAIAKSRGADPSQTDKAREMAAGCKRALADAKLSEADEAARSGDLESAAALLHDATEICDDDAISETVRERLKDLEARDARSLVEEVDHIDDDELLTIIAGTWSDARADEYSVLPENLRDGLLADHDGRHEEAVAIFKEILARTDLEVEPCYLYFELGKALLLCKRFAESLEMLDTFFAKTADASDALETRLEAYDMKAASLGALERPEEAETALREAAKAAPESHVVFLKLGVYLRRLKKFDASVRALEKSRELMGQMHPDFSVIRELGFTYLAMDKKKEAADCLGAVIEHLASRGEHSAFDPVTAAALAALYEEQGDLQRAADLFRHLAVGYDTENYFTYNYQAARLLGLSGADRTLVERYLARARELAETEDQIEALDKLEAE